MKQIHWIIIAITIVSISLFFLVGNGITFLFCSVLAVLHLLNGGNFDDILNNNCGQ